MRARGIWTTTAVCDRLSDEARWLTTPSDKARWKIGTWVNVYAWTQGGGYSSVGMPAWMLPWNRPQRKKPKAK